MHLESAKKTKLHGSVKSTGWLPVLSDSLKPYKLEPTLLRAWNSPDKNPGVGCHSLLQGSLPTQRSKGHLWRPPYRQAGPLPLVPPINSESSFNINSTAVPGNWNKFPFLCMLPSLSSFNYFERMADISTNNRSGGFSITALTNALLVPNHFRSSQLILKPPSECLVLKHGVRFWEQTSLGQPSALSPLAPCLGPVTHSLEALVSPPIR